MQLNPETDIEIVRHLAAPPAVVWRCWSEPDLFRQWYAPKPWTIPEAVLDLRPGGRFYMIWAGTEGQSFANEGAFLAAVPQQKLVFTDLMTQGFVPVPAVSPDFGPAYTAVLTFEPEGTGTLYRAVARHSTADDAKANREMGFQEGWTVTADQLDALATGLM